MTLRTTTRTALVTASLAASLMLGGVALADGFYADGSDSGNGTAATQTQQGGGRGNGAQAGKGSQGNGAKLVTASNGSVSFQVPAGWDRHPQRRRNHLRHLHRSERRVPGRHGDR